MLTRHVVRELLKISCDIFPHQKRKKHWAEKALDNLIVYKFFDESCIFALYSAVHSNNSLFWSDILIWCINSSELYGYKV